MSGGTTSFSPSPRFPTGHPTGFTPVETPFVAQKSRYTPASPSKTASPAKEPGAETVDFLETGTASQRPAATKAAQQGSLVGTFPTGPGQKFRLQTAQDTSIPEIPLSAETWETPSTSTAPSRASDSDDDELPPRGRLTMQPTKNSNEMSALWERPIAVKDRKDGKDRRNLQLTVRNVQIAKLDESNNASILVSVDKLMHIVTTADNGKYANFTSVRFLGAADGSGDVAEAIVTYRDAEGKTQHVTLGGKNEPAKPAGVTPDHQELQSGLDALRRYLGGQDLLSEVVVTQANSDKMIQERAAEARQAREQARNK